MRLHDVCFKSRSKPFNLNALAHETASAIDGTLDRSHDDVSDVC